MQEPSNHPAEPDQRPALNDLTTRAGCLKSLRATFAVFRESRPLRTGVAEDLKSLGIELTRPMKSAIAWHVTSPAYLRNLAAGTHRYDLEGRETEEILKEHQDFARSRLAGGKARPGVSAAPRMKELDMQANNMKVTAVVTDFDRYLNTETKGMTGVPVRVESAASALTATLNPKSFRKAQSAFRDLNGEAAVVISGVLDIGARVIRDAGISVQPKKGKPAE